jgi:glycine cleavage system H protein
MSDIPTNLLYTEDHEYVKSTDEDGVYVVGITDYAQGELGDIVFIELPKVGQSFGRKDTFGTVEAVKAVSDLYLPIGGEIVAVNDALSADPSVVNSDPYGDGWMVKVRASEASEIEQLLGPDEYGRQVGDA